MKNERQTIRRIVGFLNNPENEGGFWLPNIQRPFVWTEEQICRLFDSIMREYPISTLLIWKTKSAIRRRKFIDIWNDNLRLSNFYVPVNESKKCLVLDGQQRLQSLFIGLCGSYEGKELYFDLLSGEAAAPDDIRYKFRFFDAANASFPWVKFKDLIFTTKNQRQIMAELKEMAGRTLTDAEEDKLDENLDTIDRTFKAEETISYQELDSIDNPVLYKEDDVVEIFIRANSGGTRLSKSDLLFSLLTASWEVANEEMESLLKSLNQHGFEFDRDFVLKTALVLLDQGARYEVEKFRKPGIREAVEGKWEEISKAIQDVLDFVRGKTYIRCGKALPTYLVLIPLIYLRFHFPKAWEVAKDKDNYLLRASLAGAFSGSPDNLIDALVRKIRETEGFDLNEIYGVIRSQGRSLELTEERLWDLGYGSNTIHLLFNIWYTFDYVPAYANNLPQVDHIFPQSVLKRVKTVNPGTGRKDITKYREGQRNQLANCMLLTMKENGAGGKGDTPPDAWFSGKNEAYLEAHLIPKNPELWKLENFEKFIEARKSLILDKFKNYIVGAPAAKSTAASGQ